MAMGGVKKEVFIPELISVSKSQYNSYRVDKFIHWYKIEALMGEHFGEFEKLLLKITNTKKRKKNIMDYYMVSKKYSATAFDELFTFLRKHKKTSIVNFLSKGFTSDKMSEILKSGNNKETLSRGIATTSVLRGEIIIPMEQEDLDNLYVSCGKILDGGVAEIIDVIDEDDMFDISDFRKISDIPNTIH